MIWDEIISDSSKSILVQYMVKKNSFHVELVDSICIPVMNFIEQDLNSYFVDLQKHNIVQDTIDEGYAEITFLNEFVFIDYDFVNVDANCNDGKLTSFMLI